MIKQCKVNNTFFFSIVIKAAKETEENDPRLDVLRTRLKSDVFIKELESLTEASFVAKSLRNVLDQIKLLKESVNTSIDNAKTVNRENIDGKSLYNLKQKLSRINCLNNFS